MRVIVAFAMAAALAACASAPPAPSAGPLRAELTEDEFGARVQLSAPAYVALFRITPGVGAILIYPRDEADRPQLRAGSNVIVARTSTRGARALAGGSGNTYLYLIASRDPLEVEQFQTGDRDVREVIGNANATSNDLAVVMQSLDVAVMSTDATVAGPWTSDVLTPWERVASRPANRAGQGARGMGLNESCNGTWVSGHCRGVQPTPAERRANRPGGGGGGGGAAGGGAGGATSKPGGTGSTGNN